MKICPADIDEIQLEMFTIDSLIKVFVTAIDNSIFKASSGGVAANNSCLLSVFLFPVPPTLTDDLADCLTPC